MSRKARIRTAAPGAARRSRILENHPRLCGRLQQIAHFILDPPNDTALETGATFAERAQVQPSTIIRFAQTLGFSGFSQMQRLYHTMLLENVSRYSERRQRALSMAARRRRAMPAGSWP